MNAQFNKGMGFLPGLAVTLDNLVTNVPPSTLQPWVADQTYAQGAEIIDADGYIWRSQADDNLGNDPATSATKWQRTGVENRLRMFDTSLGTSTETDDLVQVTITPGRAVTDIWLTGVFGHTVQAVMVDPIEGNVFDSGEQLMLRPSGNSHWGYFFHPIEREHKLHLTGLPAYTQASITITIRNPGAKVRCAECVLGRAIWLGDTRWRPSIGFDDWSQKGRDDWGAWQIQEGAYSDRLKLQVLVRGTDYERVRNQILAYRAKPVVWFGARGNGLLTTYGYVTGFEQVLVAHGFSDCNLTIEGLEDDALYSTP